MIKKILSISVGITIFFGVKLCFGQEEKIDLPEVIITGEDRSIFKEEDKDKKEEKEALEELISNEAKKEIFPTEQEKENFGLVKKEKLKDEKKIEEKKEEKKENKFISSSFTLSYGSFETLFYKHLFSQQTKPINYLLKIEPGNKSSGFSYHGKIFDEYIQSAFDLEAKIKPKDKIGLNGSFGFYEEKRALPYLSQDIDAKKALGINFSVGSNFFLSSITELAFRGSFAKNDFSLLQNEKKKKEQNAQILRVDLRLSTLWQKKFPLSLNAIIFKEKLKQEYQASSIYVEANRLKIRPVVINAKVGWDHRDQNPFVSRLGFAIEALYPYREKALFFASVKESLNNPTSTTLYLKKDYVWINEGLCPEKIFDISLGATYRLSALSLITLTLFGKEVNNFIVWEDKDDTDPRLFEPANIKEARFSGATCELKYHLGKELIHQTKYTYTETDDKIIPYLPKQHLLTNLTYIGKRGYEIVLSYELVGSRYSSKENSTKILPKYSLLSLKMSKKITHSLNLFLEGRNLLNEHKAYKWSKYPLRRREIEVGINVNF